MEIFLVGGAVRDFLLGKLHGTFKSPADEQAYWQNVEKDWVVVGSSPDEMIQLGFRPVGKSFPVFLHPKTNEEFALARTERKTGQGYTGFECYAGQNVTLEEDLKRRDITINAIAAPPNFKDITFDTIIDPFNGLEDLKNKKFKHVSQAFAEDPVRILRIARLACRFKDFEVEESTLNLMTDMVAAGEVDALIAERVWQEWCRSLTEQAPWRWFEILEECSAAKKLFPEVSPIAPKKSILAKTIQDQAAPQTRLAIELYDSEEEKLQQLIERYRIPREFRELVLLVARNYESFKTQVLTAENVLALFERTDAFRRPERFREFLTACSYIMQKGLVATEKVGLVLTILEKLLMIDSNQFLAKGLEGKEFALALQRERLIKIEELLSGL